MSFERNKQSLCSSKQYSTHPIICWKNRNYIDIYIYIDTLSNWRWPLKKQMEAFRMEESRTAGEQP
jgi:hypothetical protein